MNYSYPAAAGPSAPRQATRIASPGKSWPCEPLLSIYAVALLIAAAVISRLLERKKDTGQYKPIDSQDLKDEYGWKSSSVLPPGIEDGANRDRVDCYRRSFPNLPQNAAPVCPEAGQKLARDKELYWQLQSIEDHPGLLS